MTQGISTNPCKDKQTQSQLCYGCYLAKCFVKSLYISPLHCWKIYDFMALFTKRAFAFLLLVNQHLRPTPQHVWNRDQDAWELYQLSWLLHAREGQGYWVSLVWVISETGRQPNLGRIWSFKDKNQFPSLPSSFGSAFRLSKASKAISFK